MLGVRIIMRSLAFNLWSAAAVRASRRDKLRRNTRSTTARFAPKHPDGALSLHNTPAAVSASCEAYAVPLAGRLGGTPHPRDPSHSAGRGEESVVQVVSTYNTKHEAGHPERKASAQPPKTNLREGKTKKPKPRKKESDSGQAVGGRYAAANAGGERGRGPGAGDRAGRT